MNELEHYVAIASAILTLLPLVLRVAGQADKPWAERLMKVGNDFVGAAKRGAK